MEVLNFVILTFYSGGENDWENRLNTILNLLAYQLVTNSDETAFLLVSGLLKIRPTLDDFDDIFLANGRVNMTFKKRRRIIGLLWNVLGWPLLFQSIYSRSYIILILFGIALMIYIWSLTSRMS